MFSNTLSFLFFPQCQILIKLEFSRQIVEKSSNNKFHENPNHSSGSLVVPCAWSDRRTDRKTDRNDRANSRFLQFCELACRKRTRPVKIKIDSLRILEKYVRTATMGMTTRRQKSISHINTTRYLIKTSAKYRYDSTGLEKIVFLYRTERMFSKYQRYSEHE